MKDILTLEEIPDIPLYMDQIIHLLDDKLQNHKQSPDDKILTKTMINNYSKEDLIDRVKGKTYTKHQIVQMLLVYYLKNGLSIQEIKQLLLPLYDDQEHLMELYQQFIENREKRKQQIETILAALPEESSLQVMELIELSSELQTIAKQKL
ncbi:DUF1836 domain-containing protein [Tannockella kyphosi]|uniref:DUF1836 domain-containing protein n=1 Tax=Tannockella kyphosi TaxID=2899121 RepID=UPI002010DFC6|nr:DUF1836 domain-containing protein [Tannockella kyphosi]